MLNFAEQTGSGAVIVVWSFLSLPPLLRYITHTYIFFFSPTTYYLFTFSYLILSSFSHPITKQPSLHIFYPYISSHLFTITLLYFHPNQMQMHIIKLPKNTIQLHSNTCSTQTKSSIQKYCL